MPEARRDLEESLRALDTPRALPPALAERLRGALSADGGPLAGSDDPRPLPPVVRDAILVSLGTATVGGAGSGSRPLPGLVSTLRGRRHRVLATAAAVLAVLGLVAAVTRSTSGPAGDLAADARSITTTAGPRGPGVATTTTAPALPPGSEVPAGGPIVALAESEPAYARLETFGDCNALLAWARINAEQAVTEYGLDGGIGFPVPLAGGFDAGVQTPARPHRRWPGPTPRRRPTSRRPASTSPTSSRSATAPSTSSTAVRLPSSPPTAMGDRRSHPPSRLSPTATP